MNTHLTVSAVGERTPPMSELSHITILSYDDYQKDKSQMTMEDSAIHRYFQTFSENLAKLSDTEAIIASLKGVNPAEVNKIINNTTYHAYDDKI